MIALLRLFQHMQIGVLIFFLGPCSAINTLQHLVLAITTPIRTGQLHELKYLQLTSGWDVRTAAKIRELSFGIKRYIFALRNAGNNFCLIELALLLKELNRLIAWHHLPNHRLILLGQLRHLFLKSN